MERIHQTKEMIKLILISFVLTAVFLSSCCKARTIEFESEEVNFYLIIIINFILNILFECFNPNFLKSNDKIAEILSKYLKLYKQFHPDSVESDANSLESIEFKKTDLMNVMPNIINNNNNNNVVGGGGNRLLKRKLMTYRYGKRSEPSFENNYDKLQEFIKNIKSQYDD